LVWSLAQIPNHLGGLRVYSAAAGSGESVAIRLGPAGEPVSVHVTAEILGNTGKVNGVEAGQGVRLPLGAGSVHFSEKHQAQFPQGGPLPRLIMVQQKAVSHLITGPLSHS
jgi:hypothetical protein